MDKGTRSGDLSGSVVKHKNSSDKGSGGLDSSSSCEKAKKRPRLELGDSSSGDVLLVASCKRISSKHDGSDLDKGSVGNSEIGRNRDEEEDERDEDAGGVGGNGNKLSERKSRLDVFEFDEYGGIDDVMPMKKYLAYSGFGGSFSSLKGKHGSDKPIRVQGKHGVLKIMVNQKKKVGGSSDSHDDLEAKEYTKGLTIVCALASQNLFPSFKMVRKPKSDLKSLSVRKETSDDPVSEESNKNNSNHSEDLEDNSTSKLSSKTIKACKSIEGESSSRMGKNTHNQLLTKKSLKRNIQCCTGTEKQKLREQIKEMLLNAGWSIDYRPRRNRDYLDAVYINPSGTGYWSIIKAYEALQKQLTDEEDEAKVRSHASPFMPLSEEALSQLTRKTKKTVKRGMKTRLINVDESEDEEEPAENEILENRDEEDSADSCSDEEKLSSFIKRAKLSKSRKSSNRNEKESLKDQSAIDQIHDNIEKPSSLSNFHSGGKSTEPGRCTLVVRNSTERQNSDDDDGYVLYPGKRTILSWLVDCGTVQLRQKVHYRRRRRTKVILEGWLTTDGIHCGCCNKILTVSKFEIHAGSKLHQPYQNIYLDSGLSLLECQFDAWKQQGSAGQIGFHSVDVNRDDPNDDTCGLCGDGGDLICCDGCPSTFHQSCLDIEKLPPGDWHCQNCICKFCGLASENTGHEEDASVSTLLVCCLCAKQYHKACMLETKDLSSEANVSDPCFCEKKCKEVFEQLQKILGFKHELEAGFSWSLIHRTDVDSDASTEGFSQKIQCNSKLAVALSIMDECFLPIIDRRSGVNIIHNVLYNRGSNFSRLNYGGFYTAILERGDEIISAASIRLHGTQLAEMPFIGTRPMYRRQGMCRRLFEAIESELFSLKVEKLIIPAVSELTDTWTEGFGFTTLQKSLKQELKSMNVLVFPGIDMLQKQIFERKILDVKVASVSVSGKRKESSKCTKLAVMTKLEIEPSAGNEAAGDTGLKHAGGTNDELDSVNSGSPSSGDCLRDNAVKRTSSDSSQQLKNPESPGENITMNPCSGVKLDESASDKEKGCIAEACDTFLEMRDGEDKTSPADFNSQPLIQDSLNVTDSNSSCLVSLDKASKMNNSLEASQEHNNVLPNGASSIDSQSDGKTLEFVGASGSREEDNLPAMASSTQCCKESSCDGSHAVHKNESASDEHNVLIALRNVESPGILSADKFAGLSSSAVDQSQDVTEVETKTLKQNQVSEEVSGGAQTTDAKEPVVLPMEKNTPENCAMIIDGVPLVPVSTGNTHNKPYPENDMSERESKSDAMTEAVHEECIPDAAADVSEHNACSVEMKSDNV